MLRCIHCRRSERQTVLTSSFECADHNTCETVSAALKVAPKTICLYSDCACIYGAETHLGIGLYTTIDGEYSEEYSGYKYIGTGTVPQGEFIGVLHAIKAAILISEQIKKANFRIFCDAQFVTNTINGNSYCGDKFRPYYNTFMHCKQKLGIRFLGITWINREINTAADALSKKAISHLKIK